jgi:hypothetical protein
MGEGAWQGVQWHLPRESATDDSIHAPVLSQRELFRTAANYAPTLKSINRFVLLSRQLSAAIGVL